ncbi:DUF1405 domain-containing protein [Schinkia azotoformans]|uniref:DUF1405 domain-containing protein n=1 Tax=Schinkia azotoformans LMG 9581 TaxID=1131731 RepID=K6DG79_SCHAZ|nr:DUF1405 domain-containing protein [Schinkia azotoformans]EKN67334.1 hypothetical protein BAZO_09236 [Schinkia azotoformans LMG 9581]MEC1639413.1 DUF1405 domain-containing protein [Schinkia azotoformans]MEC1719636.1 DUF1405 domain-containing protein [Schinkia azotoformans]MEC1944333.1 DUF1405 domain-containing protein [Schinkia azotoformans]MED4352641.1 DUF1405 domain-containing protein [Schinkia azotoformans]
MKLLIHFLGMRPILWLLLVINIFGTIWGYIWYGWQLAETPPRFLLFVPDSPTASLFFVIVLIAFLLRKNWPIIEALAIVTLFKYGIWAVVMNLLVLKVEGSLPWEGYMLIASHFAMAAQGLLYAPYYRLKAWHLIVAAVWTLHNDVIDYVFGMMPRYGVLSDFTPQIGYFTFWLSIASILITYWLCIRDKHYQAELQ